VSQVGEAVTQMDQATQQNAALVEEMAAAASSLKAQAQDLVQVVAVFKLGANDQGTLRAPAQVRASSPSTSAFKDVNRRQVGVSKNATVRAPAPVRSTVAKASAPKAISSSSSSTSPAGGEGEWETF